MSYKSGGIMKLKYKEDFEEAKKYWRAFWEGEIIDRPLLISNIPKNKDNPVSSPPYLSGIDGNFKRAIEDYERYAESTVFFAESIPNFTISFGPDTISYFIKGAESKVRVGSGTAWIEPFIDDWRKINRIEIDKENIWYKGFMNFYRYAGERGEGKFLLQMPDAHTHLDLLRAIRGSEELCIDLVEIPDEIERRLREIKDFFREIYMEIFDSTNMKEWGTTSWIPLYCEGKYEVLQCDFTYMIGQEMFRRFALPYIEEEANFLDHCIFHVDGPGVLRHLDDLLSIKKIDAIQWVPGEGNKLHIYWIDLFKRIKEAGKRVIIYPQSVDEVKVFHKELGPENVVYQLDLRSLEEGKRLVEWLIQNT
jgi:5-methyltetrahydrofolate--homocysteine methyltransferase